MKLVFLTHNTAGVGGSYIRAFSLASHLVTLGHEVTLIASRSKPGIGIRRLIIDGVHQIEMPDLMPRRIRNGGLSPFDILLRLIWVLFNRFDIVHAFDHRPAVLIPALLGKKLRGATFISDWADLWGLEGIASQRNSAIGQLIGLVDQWVESRSRLWADGVTAISSTLYQRLKLLGIPEERRIILAPGANLSLFQPIEKARAREILRLPKDAHIAAFSGYAPYDQEFLIQSILVFLREDPNGLVISSGASIPKLTSISHESGDGDRIEQFGTLPIDQMGTVLGAADVLILPYLNTSVNRGRFPNKFGDYLAAGRPIITHRTGDLGQLVEREGLGILSSEDPEKFGSDMVEILKTRDACQRLGRNARLFAEQRWNWKIRAQEVSSFYNTLL